MTNIAYSYVRFSTPEQSKGHSLTRQLEKTQVYCKANDLTLDTTLTLQDLGVSAFEGKNLESGSALHMFIKAIEEGKVLPGSSLIIESLDRLSRQQILPSLALLSSILAKGVKVITLADNTVYDENSLNDPGQLIVSITIMSRAHEESRTKSMRLLAANRNKRENIDTKKLTSICPAWLQYDEKTNDFTPIPKHVKTVKLIFELSASGKGTYSIISELTKKDIKPIAKSDTWHHGYLSKILKGRAVLGDFVSSSKDGTQTYENYYPAIISEELYYRVQNGIAARNVSGGGRKGTKTHNLFQKIIICGYSVDNNNSGYKCDGKNETIILNNKGTKKKKGYTYLQCYRNKRSSTGCTECRKLWRLDHFETSFLSFISEVDTTLLIGTPTELKIQVDNLQSQLISDKEKLKHIKSQIDKITKAMLDSESDIPSFLLDKGKKLETEQNIIFENIKLNTTNLKTKEHEYNNSGDVKEKLNQLIDIMPTLKKDELYKLRQQLSSLLQSTIERIEVYSCGDIITDKFIATVRKNQGKKASDILIKNKQQTQKATLPYFIVHFKSGSYRQVATDPKDPTRLIISITPQGAESMLLGDISHRDK